MNCMNLYWLVGFKIVGKAIDVKINGIILDDGTHVVQEHIIMFKRVGQAA